MGCVGPIPMGDASAPLDQAVSAIRAGIQRMAKPVNHILAQAQLPAEVAAVDGGHCIAEDIVSRGRQCTQEGHVYHGEVQGYGTVDSVREGRHRSCFSRCQYPSALPRPAQERMSELTRRIVTHVGYDDAPFNIEYYWDEARDALWLPEINARISKSRTPLFQIVGGAYHLEGMLDPGPGRRPRFPMARGATNARPSSWCAATATPACGGSPTRRIGPAYGGSFPMPLSGSTCARACVFRSWPIRTATVTRWR
jgi:hypothetical protein